MTAIALLISTFAAGPVTPRDFASDIAPILHQHCASCHHPGESGPFSLLTYQQARKHAAGIVEAIADGRMPPWHATSERGRFRGDPTLTAEQKRTIAEWVKQGCPPGNLAAAPKPPEFPDGWTIGTPDAIIPLPQSFAVPAEGVLEYQHFLVDPGFTRDMWVTACEVRPTNRQVVHHCNIFLQPPEVNDPRDAFRDGVGSANLTVWIPGVTATRYRDGMAMRIPAGWKLHFVMHYAPIGRPQEDRTEVGLKFCEPHEVQKEVCTILLVDGDLSIPPHAANHIVEKTWRAEQDVILYSMQPHMHLRGKSFRYTAEYPDGSREVLLDVTAYDFNWQHRYELVEPRRLPAGTVLRCTAAYDNSTANPFNPDPNATVKWGEQSRDEMFNAYFDVALADQDIAAGGRTTARAAWQVSLLTIAVIAAWLLLRRLALYRPTSRQ